MCDYYFYQCARCLRWGAEPCDCTLEPTCPVRCVLGFVWTYDTARDVWVADLQLGSIHDKV